MSQETRPRFTYLGHSAVRCDLPGGEVVLIDPFLTGNPTCPSEACDFPRLDVLLVTHAHADHIGDTLDLARRYKPGLVIGTFELSCWLERQGVENVSPMHLGGTQPLPGGRVTMVRADHGPGFLDEQGTVSGGTASGFVVRLDGGFSFYHAGDTALFSDMELIGELYRPELAFLPIGDLFTMDPRQAALACRFLGIRKVIPIHWGTFGALTGTPEQLERELADLGVSCEVVVLQPGESY